MANKQPEEQNKTQLQSQEQAQQSAADQRQGDQNRTNRTESEHKPASRRVGEVDEKGVYKHEGAGAVSQENMRTNAAVQRENDEAVLEMEDKKLFTTPQAAEKLLAEGARNKAEPGTSRKSGEEMAKQLEERPLRRIVDHTNQAEMVGRSAGSPTMEYVMTNAIAEKPEKPAKLRVGGSLQTMFDEWFDTLSSSEREAYDYYPENALHGFLKHMGRMDIAELRSKVTREE